MNLEETPHTLPPFSYALEVEPLRPNPRLSDADDSRRHLLQSAAAARAAREESSCQGIGSKPYWVAAWS